MRTPASTQRGTTAVLALVPIVILLLPFVYSLVSTVVGPSAEDPKDFLTYPDRAVHPTCIIPNTEDMRYHHMDVLKEIRDEVLRDGIRGDVRFVGCKSCHTKRSEFCNKCHDRVNLSPDCFGCHDYP